MKTYFKKHKWKIAIGLIIISLIGAVSFAQILDRTKIKRKMKVEYIIVHYTANMSPRADAEMNALYLRNKRQAGTHYAIDDENIIQCTNENMVAYAVGDRYRRGFTPKPWLLKPNGSRKVLNHNSLSFEMCLGGGRNDDAIIETTAQMVGWQLVNKGLDISRVLRHHDVTGKFCPKFDYYENDSIPVFNAEYWNQSKEDSCWTDFKKRVIRYQEFHLSEKERKKAELKSRKK